MKVGPLPFANAADSHRLSLFRWQLIGALSFAGERFSEGQQVANFTSSLRKVTRALGVRFQDVVWGLKLEYGRWSDRPHFHFVLAGLSGSQVCVATCERLKRAWHQKSGAREADIEVFVSAENGLEYIAKRPLPRPANAVRSTAKFGVNGEDMLFSQNFVRLATHKPPRVRTRSFDSFLRE